MLSMKLALRMLREAKNKCFGDILRMELNVALHKAQDSDFEHGVSNVLMKPSKGADFSNPGFAKDISADQVSEYFSPHPLAQQVPLEVVENSLLPTRHFFD